MKIFTGKVISWGKMAKTAVVEVETLRRHPLYKKIIKKRKKFLVHAENLDLKEGDIVKFKETRPISKRKHFQIVEIKNKGEKDASVT